MSRVRDVTPKVFEILKEYPETRSNDKELLLKVYTKFYHVFLGDPFYKVMRRKDLPSMESIRRARQRIQEYYPDFRAEEPVDSIRIAEQEEYIEYSREELAI